MADKERAYNLYSLRCHYYKPLVRALKAANQEAPLSERKKQAREITREAFSKTIDELTGLRSDMISVSTGFVFVAGLVKVLDGYHLIGAVMVAGAVRLFQCNSDRSCALQCLKVNSEFDNKNFRTFFKSWGGNTLFKSGDKAVYKRAEKKVRAHIRKITPPMLTVG